MDMKGNVEMKGKRVFVSGGAGVIGLEMVPLLIDRGAAVFVGDLKPRPTDFPMEVRYRQGDLNSLMSSELEAFAPDTFIHLAATFERSTETHSFWDENFLHNICLSHHLMSIAKELPGLKRVVFASSYLIYDPVRYQFNTPQTKPVSLRESDPILPRNLIGMAKLAHEIELRFLGDFPSSSFTTACARIYRGYGRNSRDVISRWVRALLVGESIIVYRPEGMFDYIYARDSAEGLIRLADCENVSGIINLGTGKARHVQDIIDILRKYFPDMKMTEEGSDIQYEASQADMSAYHAAVGWMPEYNLERAISAIISHEKEKLVINGEQKQKVGHILVTSAAKKVPLIKSVQSAARKIHPETKVIAGDLDSGALTRHIADDFWEMPRTVDSTVDTLVAGCIDRGICTIVPTRDGELLFWAQNQSYFEGKGIDIVVSPAESIQICFDKYAFSQFGVTHEFPFIPTGNHPDEIGQDRYVVKERYGAGSQNIGLNLDKIAALEFAKTLETPIYQPYITGTEISVDAWMDRFHQVKGLVLRTRDCIVDGESQVTTTFQNSEIETMMRHILHALKLRGSVVVQAIIDEKNNIHIIECNARFGGASTAAIAAGLDIFYWSLLESYGADVNEYPFNRILGEVRQVRIPNDIYEYGNNF